MMKSRLMMWAGVVVVLVMSCASFSYGAGELVDLKLRLTEGRSYNLEMTMDQKTTQEIYGQKQELQQSISTGYTFKVDQVDADGVALIQVTYDRIGFKQEAPYGTTEYDSANPPKEIPPMAKGFAALVGQSFFMKMASDGSVTEVKGADALLDHVIKNIDLPDGPMKEAAEKGLKEQFGDEGLREVMEGMMGLYPDNPVAVGDSWKKKIAISKGFPSVIDNTWTLKEVKDGIAVVDVASTIGPNPDAQPLDMGFMKMSYSDIAGEQKGTVTLKVDTGWPIETKLNQKFSGKITMGQSEQMPQGMTWPIEVDGVITITSTDNK